MPRQRTPQLAHVWELLGSDRKANRGDPKSQLVLTIFRLSQAAISSSGGNRVVVAVVSIVHRLITEVGLGVELPLRLDVGPGLTIHHGIGLVVNERARIGAGVTLRNGVVIGEAVPGGGAPVLKDGVDVGSGAIVLGNIVLHERAVVGAGAVVVKDVAAGATVVGNPARVLPRPS